MLALPLQLLCSAPEVLGFPSHTLMQTELEAGILGTLVEDEFTSYTGLGVMAHTCNPSTLGGRGRRITRGQEFETTLANMVKPPSLLKIQKLARHELWEAKAGKPPEVRNLRPAWPTWCNSISTKNTKISWAWWRTLVIPATQEAETGQLLEPRRRRLQFDKPRVKLIMQIILAKLKHLFHTSPDFKVKVFLKGLACSNAQEMVGSYHLVTGNSSFWGSAARHGPSEQVSIFALGLDVSGLLPSAFSRKQQEHLTTMHRERMTD
ncbi:putative uncharacterized protein C8orf44 [Plecturocebus cupreus]